MRVTVHAAESKLFVAPKKKWDYGGTPKLFVVCIFTRMNQDKRFKGITKEEFKFCFHKIIEPPHCQQVARSLVELDYLTTIVLTRSSAQCIACYYEGLDNTYN